LRINRFLAQAGLGSRRHVEQLVRDGRVRLNSQPVSSLGTQVDPASDRVEVDGRRVRPLPQGRLLMLHKPEGVVCSLQRQGAQPCLVDLLPDPFRQGRLFHVGRLDRDSSGLLLLTDDGDLAQRLTHPSHPVWKEYEVDFDAALSGRDEALLRDGGLSLDGRPCAPLRVRRLEAAKPGARYQLSLREGRNRQIRRMALLLGREVLRLRRVGIGPLRLGELPPGQVRELTPAERDALERAAPTSQGPADVPGQD
jgi:pseudouridine synthase